MKTSNFKELAVWQKSMNLAVEIYELIRRLPPDERYGLSDQIRRSTVSIPSNIAEGHARNTAKEFLRFLSISRGSAAELQTQLILSTKIGYLTEETSNPLIQEIVEIDKMLCGLMRFIKSKHQQSDN